MKCSAVSVFCVTHNHHPFERICSYSFLFQKINFTLRVLLHDDDTIQSAIGIKNVSKYPDILSPTTKRENQFSKKVRAMMAMFNFLCDRGEHITLCEGDLFLLNIRRI